jgi:hypothetical protein
LDCKETVSKHTNKPPLRVLSARKAKNGGGKVGVEEIFFGTPSGESARGSVHDVICTGTYRQSIQTVAVIVDFYDKK